MSRFVLRAVSVATVAVCGVVATPAIAIGPEVIYTKIPTHPTSVVPGARNAAGDPVETRFRALENLLVSPDGSRWIIKGRTQLGTGLENIMLIGSETSGGYFAQAGQPIPDGTASEKYDFFGSGLGRFNESNHFAYSARAMGGTASVFQKVMVHTGGLTYSPSDFKIVAQMGQLYTGLVDLAPNPSGDETIGNSIGSIHIQNNGVIGAQDSTINLIHTSRRPAIFYSNAFTGGQVTFNSFQQAGVSTFLDIDGITPRTYGTTLSANTFYTTLDGTRWLVHGQILGAPTASDTVLIVDGRAVLQEGTVLPSGGPNDLVHSFVTSEWSASGDWYSRGTRRANLGDTSNNGAWAVRNGELIALTGRRISSQATGPSENWGASISAFTGNANGDWVVVGRTDNPDTGLDDVVVVNGEVVLREGDPLDLDGNGLYDDDVFIGRGVNSNAAFLVDNVALTDDMMLYILVNIRDGAGNDYQSSPSFGTPNAFIRLELGPKPVPCVADIAPPGGDGTVGVPDLLKVISSWGPCPKDPPCVADIAPPGGDGAVGVPDLLKVISSWGPCQ